LPLNTDEFAVGMDFKNGFADIKTEH